MAFASIPSPVGSVTHGCISVPRHRALAVSNSHLAWFSGPAAELRQVRSRHRSHLVAFTASVALASASACSPQRRKLRCHRRSDGTCITAVGDAGPVPSSSVDVGNAGSGSSSSSSSSSSRGRCKSTGADLPADTERAIPCLDLQEFGWNLDASADVPPAELVSAARHALSSVGIFTIRGHGISLEEIAHARQESMSFFDQPLDVKRQYAVYSMERNRGYEIYPHHQRFLDKWQAAGPPPLEVHPEPSTTQGIVCERFCCGPPVCDPGALAANAAAVSAYGQPYYNSSYGQVFFAQNAWPGAEAPPELNGLQPALETAYARMERLSEALLRLLSAAAGMNATALDHLLFEPGDERVIRHTSMLQVCNYPSLLPRKLRPRGAPEYQLRAKAHQDFGAFTLLARCPGTDSGRRRCGQSGALEVRLADGTWACVPARTDELTVMPGTLLEYLTAGACRGVMHRVSNPPSGAAARDSRRLSVTFVVKPDHTAPAAPPGSDVAVDPDTPQLGELWRVGYQEAQQLKGTMSRGEAVQQFRRHRQHLRQRLLLSDAAE